ncbi:MAG TPA: hypothetical protein VKJ00_08070 [Thermoanaerobaculia bacterium]|nr:hypothetical protein [Thermoanaerobaculia bacterium]
MRMALAENSTGFAERVALTAILPLRDGDPSPPSPFVPTEAQPPADILRCAETLGIPWRRLLLAEIDTEQRLRRYVDRVDECPLASALTILSSSFLRSWRVRDRIESLACQARGGSVRGAVRQLRMAFRRLLGTGERDQAAFAQHLWFAYQRVLLLQRVSRAAARSHGTMAERLALTCARTGCAYDDAAWALCRHDASPRRGHRLEAAVQKVREEGFWIPRAESEARAFDQLRRVIRSSPHLGPGRSSRRRCESPIDAPRRVALPVDAV